MKRWIKIVAWSTLVVVLLLGALVAGFFYKIRYGFPVSYETEVPEIQFPLDNKKRVLLFSKATGFRHGESIEAGKRVFQELALKNNWFLYSTEAGGVFNTDQLAQFHVVIFNNSTGRVLDEAQQNALQHFVEHGGMLMGIHGAGDNSHPWRWYVQNLTGSDFSHHTLHPQFQETEVAIHAQADSLLKQDLPQKWIHTDEWYVFLENPENHGFKILYQIRGDRINPNGNLLWITDRDFGMGSEHPVAWHKQVGKGSTFYTSMGHDARAWAQAPFVQMLQNAVDASPQSPK